MLTMRGATRLGDGAMGEVSLGVRDDPAHTARIRKVTEAVVGALVVRVGLRVRLRPILRNQQRHTSQRSERLLRIGVATRT